MEKNWYDRWYKPMLVLPVLLLVVCLIYLILFYAKTGDFIIRDTSLAGGTTLTLAGSIDSSILKEKLKTQFSDVSIREITDLTSGKRMASIIETSASPEQIKAGVEGLLERKLSDDEISIEFTGPTLSTNFYKQLIIAIIISFILMSFVIFFLFRTFIPSIAVIFAAFGDIVMPLAIIDFFGIKLSAAGIAAFLMLIGYSVDTDILLTTRVLKKGGENVNKRIYGAFKTGIFMTMTGLIAVLPAFIIVTGLPDSFRQIFLILALGLSADIINTWLTNASIIKWYASAKGIE